MLHTLRNTVVGLAAAVTALILGAAPALAMVAPPDPVLGHHVTAAPAAAPTVVASSSGSGVALTAALLAITLVVGLTLGYLARRWIQQARPAATA